MNSGNPVAASQFRLGLKAIIAVAIFAILPLWRGGNIELVWSISAALTSMFAAGWLLFGNPLGSPRLRVLIAISAGILAIQIISFAGGVLGCQSVTERLSRPVNLTFLEFFPCSVEPASSLFSLAQTLSVMVLFGVGLHLGRKHGSVLTFGAFLTVAFFYAGIGMLKLYGVRWNLGSDMIISSDDFQHFELGFVNPNNLATYLSFAAVIAFHGVALGFHAMKQGGDTIQRHGNGAVQLWVWGLLLLSLVALLIATQSRLGIASGTAGLALFAIGQLFGARRIRAVFISMGLLGLVLLIGGILQYDAFSREIGDLSTSVDIRIALYSQSIGVWLAAPVFGLGAGTFGDFFPIFNQLPATSYEVWDKAHNTYLALLTEQGLVGLALHLALFFLLFRHLFHVFTLTGASLALLGVCLIAVIAMHSLGDFSMEIFGFSGTAMVLLGTIYQHACDLRDEHFS